MYKVMMGLTNNNFVKEWAHFSDYDSAIYELEYLRGIIEKLECETCIAWIETAA